MKETLSQQIPENGEMMPARRFTMPYKISCIQYQSFEDDFQQLAVGLVDGAIIIIDLILGIEKHFLEKHPTAITAMSFYNDKSLITGSVDGRVNISDLENMEKNKKKSNPVNLRFSKCQNCQDRKIPVSRIETSSDYAIGMVIDIEGNCRFYDLIRFKKMAKLKSNPQMDAKDGPSKFRMIQNSCLQMSQDAFLGVIQSSTIYRDYENVRTISVLSGDAPADPKAKAGKGTASPVDDAEEVPPEPVPHFSESMVLIDKKYSDEKDKITNIDDILQNISEGDFYIQKSNLAIFRYEDVIFSIFPHLSQMKRKGATTREIFFNNNPFKGSEKAGNPVDMPSD